MFKFAKKFIANNDLHNQMSNFVQLFLCDILTYFYQYHT